MPGRVNKVDLHTHSTYSDGSYTPAGIVETASDIGLKAVSLTDHDTIGGIGEALAAAGGLKQPLLFIPGVEISATYKCTLHVLGYFRPDNYSGIDAMLDDMRRERHIRNLKVIYKLNGLGIRITAEEVAEIAGKEIFGRPHIAAALVRRGVAQNIPAAFNEYLAGGRKAYVGKKSIPPEDCARAIAATGGLPVLAHPSQTGMKLSDIYDLAKSLIACGLFGIEAYHPEHTPAETANFEKLAGSLNLAATGGSDFHGGYRPHTGLGAGRGNNLRVPDAVPEKLLDALSRNT